MAQKIVHLISSLKIGGAETWLVDLLASLPPALEHHVVYFYDGPNRLILEKKGIKTYCIKGFVPYDPLFILNLYRTLKKIKPSLIHSSLWAANFFSRIFAWMFNIPLISTIHLGIDCDGFVRTFIDRFLFLYNVPHYIVPVSDHVGQSLLNQSWINHEKIITIKNGIDFNRLKPALPESRSSLGLNNDFIIGAVGRFIERKNFPWLIKQFFLLHQQRPNTKLLILGIGPQEQELVAIIQSLNLEKAVILVIGKQAVDYYSYMDCFVQPSFQEGLSIALLEALYFKLVCLVASQTENHDVIQHKVNGLLFKLDDDSFITSCIQLIDNQHLRTTLAEAAYKNVCSRFSVDAMAEHYYKLYTQCMIKP